VCILKGQTPQFRCRVSALLYKYIWHWKCKCPELLRCLGFTLDPGRGWRS